MSKQIKVIQCPKCGSTQKTELKPGYFQCLNCNTEYFLDDDDININYNYKTPAPAPQPPPLNLKTVVIRAVSVAMMIGFAVLAFIFFLTNTNTNNQTNTQQADPNEKEYTWWDNDVEPYVSKDGKPIVVGIGQRDYMGDGHETKSGIYVAFYDVISGKELKSKKLDNLATKSIPKYNFKNFSNGKLYMIVNKTSVYSVNKTAFTIEDVTQTDFKNHPELINGIANIDFLYPDYGEGFYFTTNDGKIFYYFPTVDKLYDKQGYENLQRKIQNSPPDASDKIGFAFTDKPNNPEDKIKLIKYIYKDNNGGPTRPTNLPSDELHSTDFTPGRPYFDPKVLYSDNDYLLIGFKTTAAEDSPTSVQCLKVSNGEIVFTTHFTEDKYLTDGARFKDGFVIKSSFSAIAIAMNGKILNDLKLH